MSNQAPDALDKFTSEDQYSYADAAELLGVSPDTVRRLVKRGEETEGQDGLYPVTWISPKHPRIARSVLVAYLERATVVDEDS